MDWDVLPAEYANRAEATARGARIAGTAPATRARFSVFAGSDDDFVGKTVDTLTEPSAPPR